MSLERIRTDMFNLLSSIVNAFWGLVILFVVSVFFIPTITFTILLLPFALIPLCAFTLGISWFIASVGAYSHDIQHSVNLVLIFLFFISGIFFPIKFVPEELRNIFRLNPLVNVLEDARRVSLWGEMPDWQWLLFTLVFSLVLMQTGYIWFMKTKRGFTDVI